MIRKKIFYTFKQLFRLNNDRYQKNDKNTFDRKFIF